MKSDTDTSPGKKAPQRNGIFWLLVGACLLLGLIALLTHSPSSRTEISSAPGVSNPVAASPADGEATQQKPALSRSTAVGHQRTPEEIVADKITRFARSRRELVHALARRHNVTVSSDVERFFDAIMSRDWNEIEARFSVINGGESNAGHSSARPPGIEHLWPAIIDAYGAAEQVHLWPAQKLLDYGNAILDSLRPGMVYVGGTDPGRWIPELLNETSEGEKHIVITQNGLADNTYLDYLRLLYDDQMGTVSSEDAERVFRTYMSDAQKRLDHDTQFPDEPRQIRPGEKIESVNGNLQVSGQVAVMTVNELILRSIMDKNPGLSFAVNESSPMRGTYSDASPLGPLMELRADDEQKTERAQQALDYWRTTAGQVLADPENTESSAARKTYSHDLVSTANLLAAQHMDSGAEEAYRLSTQLSPSNIEAVTGLSEILLRTGRKSEADQLLQDFARRNPDKRTALETFQGSITFSPPKPAGAR